MYIHAHVHVVYVHIIMWCNGSFRLTCGRLEQGWEPVGALMDCTALLEPIKKLSDNLLSLDMIVFLKIDSTALLCYLYI